MTVYSFYLFDRHGACLTYKQWNRPQQPDDPDDDRKNMFGALFALRDVARQLAATPAAGLPSHFVTDAYALHYFETPTGFRFVLTTSPNFGDADVSHHLSEIYANVFVEFVVKNPLYISGEVIDISAFDAKLDQYIRDLPCF